MNVRIKFHGSDDELYVENISSGLEFYEEFTKARKAGEMISVAVGKNYARINPKHVLYLEFSE